MRLIDADKLLPKLWVCYEENKPVVDAEPTVEAIPIEWIEDYLQKYTDMAGEYMGKDNDIAMYGIIRLNIISELLSAWKHKDDPHEYFPYVKGEGWKRVVENETDRCR